MRRILPRAVARRLGGASALLVIAAVAAASARGQAITDPTQPAAPTPTGAPAPNPPASTPAAPAKSAGGGPPSPFGYTLAYTADMLGDVAGGEARGGAYVDLLKATVSYDGASQGHDGLNALVSVARAFGSGFTTQRVGGVQSVSAFEAYPGSTRLYEAWVEQTLFDAKGMVKVGLTDLNTTFDVQETAALFLNASQGIAPDIGDTGRNGPSDYPTPALAVTTVYRPAEGWTAQLGVFDAEAGNAAHRSEFVDIKFDGALIIGQVEKRFGDAARIELGAWSYTGDFPSLTRTVAPGRPLEVSGNAGVYGLIEGRLVRAKGSDGGLNGWIRLGRANGEINPVQDYLGAGLVYTGLFKARDKDEFGLAIARAGFGPGAIAAGALAGRSIGPAETDLEATYRYVVTDWFNVQPDLQYVIDPHGDRRTPSALVVGLRLAFTYSK
jgi:porin